MITQVPVSVKEVTLVSLLADAAPINVGAQELVITDISIPVLPVRIVQVSSSVNNWFEGAGIPLDTFGSNGDLYLDSSNGDVYRMQGGTWF